MANILGTTEVAQTPSKEQDADGQVETTEEEGANGQLPDSMSSRMPIHACSKLTMLRHLPNQD
jgi:hypothetical protein